MYVQHACCEKCNLVIVSHASRCPRMDRSSALVANNGTDGNGNAANFTPSSIEGLFVSDRTRAEREKERKGGTDMSKQLKDRLSDPAL